MNTDTFRGHVTVDFKPCAPGQRAYFTNKERTTFYWQPVIGFIIYVETEISNRTLEPADDAPPLDRLDRYISPAVYEYGTPTAADNLGDDFLDVAMDSEAEAAERYLRADHGIPNGVPLQGPWEMS